MTERKTICPDASPCYSCAAREVTLQGHYCKDELLGTRTGSGGIRVRPSNCPRELEARKTQESLKVQRALQTLLGNR